MQGGSGWPRRETGGNGGDLLSPPATFSPVTVTISIEKRHLFVGCFKFNDTDEYIQIKFVSF
jgi:hypothetical protein